MESQRTMKTPAAKVTIDQSNDDFEFFAKMPDEIIEKIISFVPCKKNCFLVSKKFKQEATNATRNRLLLNLDRDVCFESVLSTKRSFDKIQLHCSKSDSELGLCKYFLEQFYRTLLAFGSLIKKFTLRAEELNEKDFLKFLSLMPNLVVLELHNMHFMLGFTNEQLQNVQAPDDIVQLAFLREFHMYVFDSSLLSKLSCPALEKLHSRIDSSSFIRRHSQLKDIYMRTFSGLCLDHLQLTTLELDDTSESFICSTIDNQKELKTLTLRKTDITDQSLRRIVNHQNLETLDICLSGSEPISEDLIKQLVNMRRLKSLSVRTEDENVIRSMVNVKNQQLEEFFLKPLCKGEFNVEVLQALAQNFPNLKNLDFCDVAIDHVLAVLPLFKKLETVKVLEYSDSPPQSPQPTPITNPNIRELIVSVNSYWTIDSLLQVMPNVAKIKCLGISRYSLLSILKFEKLTEIECDAEFLVEPAAIQAINERGASLKKLAVRDASCVSTNLLQSAYGEQFPLMKIRLQNNYVTMLRL